MAQDGAQAVKNEMTNGQWSMTNEDRPGTPRNHHRSSVIGHRSLSVTYDPALVESVVRRRVDAAADTDATWIGPYRDELNEIYESPEQERSTAFAALDRRYFNRIGVPAVVDGCLAEQALTLERAASVTLISAHAGAEEGVDVTRDGRLVLRYRPEALLSIDQFRANLRRELIQAADCFDPAFGHAPELLDNMLPSEKERVRAALSILWGLSAQTRLCAEERARRGDISSDSQRYLEQLTTTALDTFGERHPGILTILTDLPDRPPTFRQMFDICTQHLGSQAVAAGVCDLCRFPSEDAVFLRALRADIGSALKAEFPHLSDAAQVCARCVERAIENV